MKKEALRYKDFYTTKEAFSYFSLLMGKAFLFAFLTFFETIIFLVLIFMGDTFYHIRQGKEVVPLFGEYVIITPSMTPTIKVNDAVIVRRTREEKLKVGDIITFKSNDVRYDGIIVTHRIVGIDNTSNGNVVYRTKGDNNRNEDTAIVSNSNIYGKVIFKLPKFGYLQSLVKTPIGFCLLVLLPFVLIIVINYKSIKSLIRRE